MSAKKSKSKRRRGADIIAILIILGIGTALVLAGLRYIAWLRLDMVAAAPGSLTLETGAELVMIRREHVLTADVAGEFIPTATEGSRVSAHSSVGYMVREASGSLTPAKQEVITPYGGLVSFALDGWENKLTPDSVYQTDWQYTLSLLRLEAIEAEAELAEAELPDLSSGRPLARVVDNLEPLLAFICCGSDPYEAEPGDKLTLRLNGDMGEELYSASITTVGHLNSGEWICLAGFSDNESLLAAPRYHSIVILGETISGVSVPPSAVFTDESGQTGLYRRNRDRLEFALVEVLAETESEAIISGIAVNDQVAANPEKAKPGQRLYGK